MSIRTSYDDHEWARLKGAPIVLGLAVAETLHPASKRFPEAAVALRGATEPAPPFSDYELIRELAHDLDDGHGEPDDGAVGDEAEPQPGETLAGALDLCREVATLVDRRASAAEAEAYKRWLVSVAGAVAEAANEAGLARFGDGPVTASELELLAEFERALGLADDAGDGGVG